jgi:hypothetical protein
MYSKKRTLKTPAQSGKIARSRIRHVVRALHVVPQADGWVVTASGAAAPTRQFSRKEEAVEFGDSVARRRRTGLIIHGRDGRIQEVASYGADPFPPRERRN